MIRRNGLHFHFLEESTFSLRSSSPSSKDLWTLMLIVLTARNPAGQTCAWWFSVAQPMRRSSALHSRSENSLHCLEYIYHSLSRNMSILNSQLRWAHWECSNFCLRRECAMGSRRLSCWTLADQQTPLLSTSPIV